MSGLSVEISGLSQLQESFGVMPVNSALRHTFNNAVRSLHHDIREGVKRFYAAPYDAASVADVHLGNDRDPTAWLRYKYKPIALSQFPVRQVRITVGGQKLKVIRNNRRAPFVTSLVTNRAYTYTKVMVLREGGFKTVEGMERYGFRKGWLHTGRRSVFTSQIFERDQQATWAGGMRLPFHRLLGPSISQMIASPRIQDIVDSSPYLIHIEQLILQELGL